MQHYEINKDRLGGGLAGQFKNLFLCSNEIQTIKSGVKMHDSFIKKYFSKSASLTSTSLNKFLIRYIQKLSSSKKILIIVKMTNGIFKYLF
ncbi:hypothetical protein HR09_01540 [Porphyromonas gulae]|nr:hypothetical protein HR09_01540 [Porphyromonas gulae]